MVWNCWLCGILCVAGATGEKKFIIVPLCAKDAACNRVKSYQLEISVDGNKLSPYKSRTMFLYQCMWCMLKAKLKLYFLGVKFLDLCFIDLYSFNSFEVEWQYIKGDNIFYLCLPRYRKIEIIERVGTPGRQQYVVTYSPPNTTMQKVSIL